MLSNLITHILYIFNNKFIFYFQNLEPNCRYTFLTLTSWRWKPNAWKYPDGPINCGMPKQHKLGAFALTLYHKPSGLKQHTFIISRSEVWPRSKVVEMKLLAGLYSFLEVPGSNSFFVALFFSRGLSFLAGGAFSPSLKPAMSSLSCFL